MAEQIEEQARSEGWVPKSEFHGPPENWVDAETFVKRGRELAPILSAKNKRLVDELEAQKAEIEKLKQASEEFRKIATRSIEQSKKERDQAIAALQKQKADGISEGDGAKVIKAEQQIEALKAESRSEEGPNQNDWNQRAAQWIRSAPWYAKNSPEYDEDRKIYADGVQDVIMSELPHLRNDPEGFFKELSRRVEKKFQATNENRSKTTVENAGGTKSVKTGAKTFENLPEEAKQGFEQIKFLMPKLTEEEYLKNYTWE